MGLPWAVFTTSLILFVVSVLVFGVAAMIVSDNRNTGASAFFERMIRNGAAVTGMVSLVLFLSSFWVGAIGYGWFS